MQLFSLLVVISIIQVSFSVSFDRPHLIARIDAPGNSQEQLNALKHISGGKRTSGKASKNRKPKYIEEDEDEQDEDEEDEEDDDEVVVPKSSQKKRPSKNKRKGFFKGLASVRYNVPSFKEQFDVISRQSQSILSDAVRRAKVLRSSAFESILLKATWPSDDPVPSKLLTEIIKYSIPAFKYTRSTEEDDPYHMTIHKLWTKMCENDWRTVTKSLYILHRIMKDSNNEATSKFSQAIKSLSKTRNPKNDERYFDVRLIEFDDEQQHKDYKSFVTAYANYVLHRSKLYSKNFEEIKTLNTKSLDSKVLTQLKNTQKLLQLGVQVSLKNSKKENIITTQAMKLIAQDLKIVNELLLNKLQSIPINDDTTNTSTTHNATATSTLSSSSAASVDKNNKEILSILKEYKVITEKVNSFITKHIGGSKTKNSKQQATTASSDMKSIEQKITQLSKILNLSGGFKSIKNNNKRKHTGKCIDKSGKCHYGDGSSDNNSNSNDYDHDADRKDDNEINDTTEDVDGDEDELQEEDEDDNNNDEGEEEEEDNDNDSNDNNQEEEAEEPEEFEETDEGNEDE